MNGAMPLRRKHLAPKRFVRSDGPLHVLLRLKQPMADALRTSAEENFRSLHQEVQFRLKRDMETHPDD